MANERGTPLKAKGSNRVVKGIPALPAGESGSPAIFALVRRHWLEAAQSYFKSGKEELRFSSSSRDLRAALELVHTIERIYFKAIGDNEISFRARFLSIETDDPSRRRLPKYDETSKLWMGRYYYGFCDLSEVKPGIAITSLRRYGSGKSLRNDQRCACVIYDIATALAQLR
jgi:hypothetical protein